MECTCDYCTKSATRIAKDGGDLLCGTHAADQYSRWRDDTAPLTPGTLRKYGHGN